MSYLADIKNNVLKKGRCNDIDVYLMGEKGEERDFKRKKPADKT